MTPEKRDEPKCRSCGVPFIEHLGLQGTCKALRERDATIAAKDAEIEKWHDAFYREERRAIEYHNADQVDGGFKCGHPVSCLRNRKSGGGVHCLMCEQAAEIARLTKERDAARGLVQEAYEEGWKSCSTWKAGSVKPMPLIEGWNESAARTALEQGT